MGSRLSIKGICLLFILAHVADAAVFDVMKYGAKPNSDIKHALLQAWNAACASKAPSTVTIPSGTFTLGEVVLQGPCGAPLTLQVKGILKAPPLAQIKTDAWVLFRKVDRFSLSGTGTFDGMGAEVWANWQRTNCGTNKKCKVKPTSIKFSSMNNSMISEITSKDSKMFHMNINGGSNVTVQDVTILAPGDSRNTDGIHVGRATDVKIINSKIATGDDCVSIGEGSSKVLVENVMCGPGHGISIGSIGKHKNEQPVTGVTVKNCNITKNTNGVRIKSWAGSFPNSVSDVIFENIVIDDVKNPIIIDQSYCPTKNCPKKAVPSKVKINNVSFKNIRGSSATEVAIKLDCSKEFPCQAVDLSDIKLTFNGGAAKAETANVKPTTSGIINPKLV